MNGEYPNYPREMVEEFEAQIAALTKERDDLLKLTNVQEQLPVPRLREQLKDEHIQHKRWQMACAASQAREAKLREMLKFWMPDESNMNGDPFIDTWYEHTNFLSLPQDDTALRQWGAKLLREMAEECHYDRDAEYMRWKADKMEAGK